MKKIIENIIKSFGYSIQKLDKTPTPFFDIKEAEFWEIYNICKPFTMTTVERMYSLYCSVKYVLDKNIPGSFVECGVWRGGSSMLMAEMLKRRNISDRNIYLYDTFEGMSAPTQNDVDYRGNAAKVLLDKNVENKEESVWCLADLNDVKNNLNLIGYQSQNIIFVQGKVEDTIPNTIPTEIAILRLDTDWYESTHHELVHLYPLLKNEGVLIIDDYGYWEGCRKAVDEYFSKNNIKLLLNRIDYTGRIAIK
jgi:O-methyltransferase